MKKVEERFLEYVKIDTKSDTTTGTTPSTKGQLVLADILAKELKEMGLNDVTISEYGYVYATLEKNCNKNIPTIIGIKQPLTSPKVTIKTVITMQIIFIKCNMIKYPIFSFLNLSLVSCINSLKSSCFISLPVFKRLYKSSIKVICSNIDITI